jgi:hypothetical protein
MKNKKLYKTMRHTQAVSRLVELNFWRRLRLLESPTARKKLDFME